jgi:ubiquinone/menaquinone biosynthesis C-methylase UbiE
MSGNRMKDVKAVKEQYKNSTNLDTRISIHERYSTNKQGFHNWLYEQYELGENLKILELGCGTGDLWTDHIDQLLPGTSLILSDFSEGMVEVVRNKYGSYPGVSYEQINIEAIPHGTESFDIVIANMMLYHVPDLSKGLAEVHRVLKKGGSFYCATFGENGIQQYLTRILSRYGIHIDINGSFTLQNGADILGNHFARVERRDYHDSLEVTATNDLLNYIASMASIGDLGHVTREELYRCFEEEKDEAGIIHIPKEYGMFLCRK